MKNYRAVTQTIMDYIDQGSYGIFNCRNNTGDFMKTIYDDGMIQIDWCPDYEYFEVFGASAREFRQLREFYWALSEMYEDYMHEQIFEPTEDHETIDQKEE